MNESTITLKIEADSLEDLKHQVQELYFELTEVTTLKYEIKQLKKKQEEAA